MRSREEIEKYLNRSNEIVIGKLAVTLLLDIRDLLEITSKKPVEISSKPKESEERGCNHVKGLHCQICQPERYEDKPVEEKCVDIPKGFYNCLKCGKDNEPVEEVDKPSEV